MARSGWSAGTLWLRLMTVRKSGWAWGFPRMSYRQTSHPTVQPFFNKLLTIEANRELFSKAAFTERNKGNPNLDWLEKYDRDLNQKFLKEAKKICGSQNLLVRSEERRVGKECRCRGL